MDEKEQVAAEKQHQIEEIRHNFSYFPPKPGQLERYEKIRAKAKEFALLIAEITPVSDEQANAIEDLEMCVFWANGAIARHG